jgi:hypothetical protein
MPVSLRTHADIANALKTLGVSLDDAKKLDATRAKDPALAVELKKVLADVTPGELARLKATVGDGAATSTTVSRPASTQVSSRLAVAKNGKEPKLDANTPAVAVFMQRYGMDGVAPRPLERVLVHAAKIHEIIATGPSDLDGLVEHVMKVDLRRQVFLLEGIGKVYERRYDEGAEVGEAAKELEDALGGLSATRTNLAYAQQVKAPAEVIAHLEKAERDAKKDLKKLLSDSWVPDAKGRAPALKDLAKDWGEAKWDDYASDKKYLRGELVRRLVKVSDTSFDMTKLETGIHELRRQLRWFPIYTEASNGLLQLDVTKNPVKHYEPLLGVQLATSKYVDLPDDSREVDAIHISKSLYTALMKLTLDLGGVKDAGEPVEALFAAYEATGKARNLDDAKKQVFKLIGGDKIDHDVHDNAKKLYAEMKEHKLVEKLAEQVKKG